MFHIINRLWLRRYNKLPYNLVVNVLVQVYFRKCLNGSYHQKLPHLGPIFKMVFDNLFCGIEPSHPMNPTSWGGGCRTNIYPRVRG